MKMQKMLQDTGTYKILKKDTAEKKKRKLRALLKPLLNKNKIKIYSHQVLTAESLGGSLQLEACSIVQKS